ncbi:MAG: Ni/Fe hydrogenase subunit alpha [Candidatus Limnocylindrales bacterium]
MTADTSTFEREFRVEGITRVEGEGTLQLTVHDGAVTEARLKIFEAPRYFERLLVGRTPDETIDITARICGICPVAYQTSAAGAFESIFGVQIDPQVHALRRLLYAGEYIESHALHVYLLHAPDFLGYASAIDLAKDHRSVVEQGLALKKVGNGLMAALGGRSVHPVSLRVGGFYHVPKRRELDALRPGLETALKEAQATLDLVARFQAPPFERPVRFVSLKHPDEYPLFAGRIVSNDGIDVGIGDWRLAFAEEQHEGTNALHARTLSGETYQLGPSARVTNAADQLHPVARAALERTELREAIAQNPFWSIAARAVEIIHYCAEAIDIIDAYTPPAEPFVPWQPREGEAGWGSEAPRGLCWHYYQTDAKGLVRSAQIVPPTSQNQGQIEEDLRDFAPSVLPLEHGEATRRLEQLIRSYDPCISCATHFLDLTIEEV